MLQFVKAFPTRDISEIVTYECTMCSKLDMVMINTEHLTAIECCLGTFKQKVRVQNEDMLYLR